MRPADRGVEKGSMMPIQPGKHHPLISFDLRCRLSDCVRPHCDRIIPTDSSTACHRMPPHATT